MNNDSCAIIGWVWVAAIIVWFLASGSGSAIPDIPERPRTRMPPVKPLKPEAPGSCPFRCCIEKLPDSCPLKKHACDTKILKEKK